MPAKTDRPANTVYGYGDAAVANDLYATAILQEWAAIKRDGEYPCLARIQARMPKYNQEMLINTWWQLAHGGRLS